MIRHTVSKEDIITELKRLKHELGRIPTSGEFGKLSKYGKNTAKRRFNGWNNLLLEVYGKVNRRTKTNIIDNVCVNCQNVFKAPEAEKRKFCSQGCSATYNNKYSKTRKQSRELTRQRKQRYCIICNTKLGINSRATKCDKCRNYSNRTLKECIDSAGKEASKYAYIRANARNIMKSEPKICKNCGYDKHVECCHKKEIGKFELTDTIALVNSPDNLVWLCKNCHWETHNNLLDIFKF